MANAASARGERTGLQSYFRLLLGLTFILFGVGVARTGIAARWLSIAGIIGGLLYMTIGIAVGHSGFEQPGGPSSSCSS